MPYKIGDWVLYESKSCQVINIYKESIDLDLILVLDTDINDNSDLNNNEVYASHVTLDKSKIIKVY